MSTKSQLSFVQCSTPIVQDGRISIIIFDIGINKCCHFVLSQQELPDLIASSSHGDTKKKVDSTTTPLPTLLCH